MLIPGGLEELALVHIPRHLPHGDPVGIAATQAELHPAEAGVFKGDHAKLQMINPCSETGDSSEVEENVVINADLIIQHVSWDLTEILECVILVSFVVVHVIFRVLPMARRVEIRKGVLVEAFDLGNLSLKDGVELVGLSGEFQKLTVGVHGRVVLHNSAILFRLQSLHEGLFVLDSIGAMNVRWAFLSPSPELNLHDLVPKVQILLGIVHHTTLNLSSGLK